MPRNITATSLGQRFHHHCDLQLYLSYHGQPAEATKLRARPPPSAVTTAHLHRGLAWEARLLDWLERQGELLRLVDGTSTALQLLQIVRRDPRDHFYLANLAFDPPSLHPALADVRFGLAKPDLVEVTKLGTHITLHIIDAKSSAAVKTSHLVQVYFYALCLERLYDNKFDVTIDQQVSIWLPQDHISRPTSISRALLADSLDAFLFHRLPTLLSTPQRYIDWHLNPLCTGCPFEADCTTRARNEGALGLVPNLSIADGALLTQFTGIGHWHAGGTDIEEVDRLVRDRPRREDLARDAGESLRRVKRLLLVDEATGDSPVLRAAMEGVPVATGRRSMTLPSSESLALFVGLLIDPATSAPTAYSLCIRDGHTSTPYSGPIAAFIPTAARLLRDVGVRSDTFHVYLWSQNELDHVHGHLIAAALKTPDDPDVRLCIGSLCDGAAALSAAFQPPVLSGALVDFLARKGTLAKPELVACLERMGVPSEDWIGTVNVLRGRLEARLEALRATPRDEPTVGHLPKVCVLGDEVRRLACLPAPGHWDLTEATTVLAPSAPPCPTTDQIYALLTSNPAAAHVELEQRTAALDAALGGLRQLVGRDVLLNEARPPHFGVMDLCRQPVLRKLFFIQQFEVLSRLQELWRARLDGCTDSPVLRYRKLEITVDKRWLHHFDLLSGSLDTPTEGNAAFYDSLLAPLDLAAHATPLELRFDDLLWCSSRFPLNKHQRLKWDAQPVEARRLLVAQVQQVHVGGVILVTYGSTKLVPGATYRLSPRLVDFNHQRALRNLLDVDLSCDGATKLPPLVRLLEDPVGYSSQASFGGDDLLARETRINSTYRELANLGSIDASALLLKRTQRQACRRLLGSALTVVWGPPGSGKSYTLALSLLRLVQVAEPADCGLIFVSAMTHAAIEAVLSKLVKLVAYVRAIPDIDHGWLENLSIEHVLKGGEHAIASPSAAIQTRILCGTAFQLHSWTKRSHALADVVCLDESGQLALVTAALVLGSLRTGGKLIVAGDHEQLSPIFASAYPAGPLTGSVLDLLVSRRDVEGVEEADESRSASPSQSEAPSQGGTVVQLSENFRLNADLSAFVELIYRRRFRPQKTQAARTAERLCSLASPTSTDPLRRFLTSLGDAMLGRSAPGLIVPAISLAQATASTNRPVSLAMLKLSVRGGSEDTEADLDLAELVPAEAHVRAEARVVASLVVLLREAFGVSESIFVACPHRMQRAAVREALHEVGGIEESLAALTVGGSEVEQSATTVETVERLQGSEAAFVIVTLSHTHAASLTPTELDFLLTRRRLNVALSRSQTLCILLTSDDVLRPRSIEVLARPAAASGLAFLRAYETRAWRADYSLALG